jgi:hypothetical protein
VPGGDETGTPTARTALTPKGRKTALAAGGALAVAVWVNALL